MTGKRTKTKTSHSSGFEPSKKERFEVLLEDINSNVQLLAENAKYHSERMDSFEERMERFEKTMDRMEIRLDTVEMSLEFIKHELRNKIDRDEFAALEKRVTRLESRRH